MVSSTKRTAWRILATVALGLFCSAEALAVKPPPPPDDEPLPYMLVDLLGFPDNGYQSQGMFVTNQDIDGDILIGGNSRLYPDPDGPAIFHPAMWHVDIHGDFPETDPIDLGTPACGGSAAPRGMNALGVMVADTIMAVERDADGNWVWPAYVIIPGLPFQELTAPFNRNTGAWAINDAGQIAGTYEDLNDPNDPESLWTFGAIWQLNPDGTLSGPTSLGEFVPRDINNFGVMVGYYMGWPTLAWFDDGTLLMEELDSSLEFSGAEVAAINNCPIDDPRLTVVGTSLRDATGDYYAPNRGFAWRPFNAADPTTILGTLGGRDSVALDVNTSGVIVGWSDTKKQGQQAFIFKDGRMLNLNSLTDVGTRKLDHALGISDDGDIVGFMGIPRPVSEQRGFLLRPIQP